MLALVVAAALSLMHHISKCLGPSLALSLHCVSLPLLFYAGNVGRTFLDSVAIALTEELGAFRACRIVRHDVLFVPARSLWSTRYEVANAWRNARLLKYVR